MSLVLRPKQPLHLTQQLTLLTGVAVCRAIAKCAGVQTDIKWPNDILFQGKRFAAFCWSLQQKTKGCATA